MQAAGAEAYLVNTGWNGTGKRISIKDTQWYYRCYLRWFYRKKQKWASYQSLI